MLSLALNIIIALAAPQDLSVVRLAVGEEVVARTLRAPGEEFIADGAQVWAHVTVKNLAGPTHVRMRWLHEGEQVWEGRLPVGKSPRWRTWTRMSMDYGDIGEWEVSVTDDEGRLLEQVHFTVRAPDEAC